MKLKVAIPEYASYRHSLGEKYTTQEKVLHAFERFAGPETNVADIDEKLTHDFIHRQGPIVTPGLFGRHAALKGLLYWLFVRGEIKCVPIDMDLPKMPQYRRPHIYSRDELRRMFDAALTFQIRRSNIFPECIQFVLKLTYALGLRLHEALSIVLGEIDMTNKTIQITQSKFYKSRLVTFGDEVLIALERFPRWRKSVGMPCKAQSALFMYSDHRPLREFAVDGSFARIRERIGLNRAAAGEHLPRIHDLRHTFAVHRLIHWYKEGMDVQKLLPKLSTYLGHTSLKFTSVYLSMTPDLLREANRKFESYVSERIFS